MSTSKLHTAARNYAAAGIPVFPIEEHGKSPAIRKDDGGQGFKDATTDLAQIDAWWAINPNFNIGLSPEHAGWAVIDVEADGMAKWRELTDIPESYEVETPNGGLHIYFEGSVPSSVRKLFKGEPIDTRGVGGYVLLAPSIVRAKDGQLRPYKVVHDRQFAPLPDWIGSRLAEANTRVQATVDDIDGVGDIGRATTHLRDLVRRGDVAVDGRGGNDRTYRVACELLELGLSADTALEQLEDIWNPHCIPPWQHEELALIVRNAANHAQNEIGAFATAPAAETFAAALDKLPKELTSQAQKRSRFYFENDAEMDRTPDIDWVIPELIQDRTTVMVYGATQSFKSFIMIAVAMGIATGKQTLGFDIGKRLPTFYAAGEGRDDVKLRRRAAWKLAHEVEGETGFYVAPAPRVAIADEMQEFGDGIQATLDRDGHKKPGLIVLETVSKMMVGLDPTRDAPKLTRFCDTLVEAFQCPVIVVHHTGHDPNKGPRDASSYLADFDSIIEIKGRRETKTTSAIVRKLKGSAEREEPFHFQGQVIGPSLVFHRISSEENEKLNGDADELSPKAVGAALMKLNAFGQENSVTTTVLATELSQLPENATEDQRAAARTSTARLLGTLSRTRLKAYCERMGNQTTWSLPPAEAK